jgi:hypothetical protein
MTVATGCGGSVDGQSNVRSWTLATSNAVAKYAASNTLCATGLLPGVSDWTGSYEFYGNDAAFAPGEAVELELYGATKATGNARVESLTVNIDIEGGGIISGSVAFAANGAITFASGTQADAGAVEVTTSVGCKIELDGSEVPDVRTATFTLTTNNPSYSSSSTSGGTRRLPGVLSGGGSYTVYQADMVALPDEGDVVTLEYFVSASEMWIFKYAVITDVSTNVNIENAALIDATITWQFSGYAIDGTEGAITKPDETDLWPPA